MSKKEFSEFIKNNSREAGKHLEAGRPAHAAMTIDMMESFYSPIHYDRKKYPKAPFTKAALDNSFDKFNDNTYKDTKRFSLIRGARMSGATYIFTWTAKHGTGVEGKKSVQLASRNHIKGLLKFMGEKPKEGTAKIIGAHIESSAFLMLLRKGVKAGVITEAEAQTYLDAFLTGDLESVMKSVAVGRNEATTAGLSGQNVKSVASETEIGMTYDEYKRISNKRNKTRLNVESMTPMPHGANQDMADHFEKAAVKIMKAELNNLAFEKGIEYIEVDGSFSTVRMWQEIIAAELLGKTVPKYNTKKSVKHGNPKKSTKTSGKVKIPKGKRGKRATSQVEKAKFRTQLRNAGGQYASPTALRALLNKKLPTKLIDNMGPPSLENITGRFAQSARVVNITHGEGIKVPTIQYTYDTDPYQVFEMGGKGDSRWATQARDPRFIINNTIREIAAEMMITKFNTQRL